MHSSLLHILKWRPQKPKVLPITFPTVGSLNDDLFFKASSSLTWVEPATFLIKHAGLTLITDPHFSYRASPLRSVGPKRCMAPALIKVEDAN
jgi:hypothetical protein